MVIVFFYACWDWLKGKSPMCFEVNLRLVVFMLNDLLITPFFDLPLTGATLLLSAINKPFAYNKLQGISQLQLSNP